MRILKVTLLSLLALIALFVIAVVTITATIDPNDYKTDIESVVAQNSTLKLTIKGDLEWSFMPLGVDIKDVTLEHLNGNPFTKVNQLTAQVGLLSLLKLNPQVHKIILDGLVVILEKDEQGQANWENITVKKEVSNQNNSSAESTPSANTQDTSSAINTNPEQTLKSDFKLEIEEVAITNTTIRYRDKQSNHSASLEDFNLRANSITLGNAFPLNIHFKISNSSPKLDINAKIAAAITIDSNMKQFAIRQLKSNYELAGAPFEENTVEASFSGNSITANLNEGSVSLNQIALKFANLTLNTTMDIHSLSKQPKLDGSLDIPVFSLQALLSSVGQPTIQTTDSNVLKRIGLKSTLNGSIEDLDIKNLDIQLDDTHYTGSLNYLAAKQFVTANIKGTELNIDRYLPPAVTPVTQASQTIERMASKDAETSNTDNSTSLPSNARTEPQLLPLETIRLLNLDISFIQQKLIAKNLKLNNLTLLMKAANGVITVTEASGKLYEGHFDVNAKIDASSDNPKWAINKTVNNIQIMPLLKDFQDLEIISGGINLNASIKTAGNTVSTIRSAAQGSASFDFDQGALHGFNLTKLTCEGVALINRDKVTKSDWSDESQFQSMKGSLTIDGNQFINKNITAAMSGLALIGKGVVNAETLNVNYGIDLKAIGDLGDNACRVNEKVKDLAIPILCKGSLNDDPAKLCDLDYSRMEDLVAAAGKKELERKAEKEVNKLLDKHLGDDDSDTKESVKKIFKGLF